jgi:hypothetical protein
MGLGRLDSLLGSYSTPGINFIPISRPEIPILKTSAKNWQKTCSQKSLNTVSLNGLW